MSNKANPSNVTIFAEGPEIRVVRNDTNQSVTILPTGKGFSVSLSGNIVASTRSAVTPKSAPSSTTAVPSGFRGTTQRGTPRKRRQGFTINEFVQETGFSVSRVRRWVTSGQIPSKKVFISDKLDSKGNRKYTYRIPVRAIPLAKKLDAGLTQQSEVAPTLAETTS